MILQVIMEREILSQVSMEREVLSQVNIERSDFVSKHGS